jgi:hypothetical protein
MYMSPVLGKIYVPFYYPELTKSRRANRKIWHENKILKANEPALFRSNEWHQKTYHEFSWDYPFNAILLFIVNVTAMFKTKKWRISLIFIYN